MKSTGREMVSAPKSVVQIGLTIEEADRLAGELARMEEALHEPGFGGFNVFDLGAATARRREWLTVAMPAYEVEVGPFEIDVYPVTNAQWARFMAESGACAPEVGMSKERDFVTGVSWQEAQAYAHHERLDLPMKAEWEVAARHGRSFFTWGDTYFPEGEVAFRPPVRETRTLHACRGVVCRPASDGRTSSSAAYGEPNLVR